MRLFILSGLTLLLLSVTASAQETVNSEWLTKELEAVRDRIKLVGMGATVLVDGETVAEGVSGKRRQGTDSPVTLNDKWHIGSITKSMTATVVGRLVERGELSWELPVTDALPKLKSEMHEDWQKVTLNHVLTHTAGLPSNFPVQTQFQRPASPEDRNQARKEKLLEILSAPPVSKAGEKHVYSNIGYTLAGYIAATRSGMPWEKLIQQELFTPLKLKSAGFGAPTGEQPWGHQRALFMRNPVDPDGLSDNSPIIGPAGIVHMSMKDLAAYGQQHLKGELTGTDLLKQATFQKLHKGQKDNYAYGWVDEADKWDAGRVFWHNGSNTFWYALLTVVPSRNAVIVVVTNDAHISKSAGEFFELTR